MTEPVDRTPLQELNDTFYALGMISKILDDLLDGYVKGSRDQDDFESRFHSQAWLLTDTLKKVKPLVEKTIQKGYSFFLSKDASEGSVSSNTEKQVLTGESEGVDTTA
jgi:hypothetical protein